MAIDKITTAQFREQLRTSITNRTSTHDVAYGPVRDVVIDPMSTVLERQNDRIRRVSLLVSLVNSTEYTDAELEALVYNEGLTRIAGAQASGTCRFGTLRVDATGPDLVVPRGYPCGTTTDATTGEAVTFVTTESQTLDVSAASSYLDLTLDPPQYVLSVPVVCTVAGAQGIVGAGRITRMLRPLTGFDIVTNVARTSGGRDRETNAELIERYLLAVIGRDITTPAGVERYVRDTFTDVEDALVVFGDDPILERSTDSAGACDVYIKGQQSVTRTDDVTYLGLNQTLAVTYPPVISITTVENITTPATYVLDTDYTVVEDDAVGGSNRATEGVQFTATSVATPAVGDTVRITYESNNLVRRVQDSLDADDVDAIGRDALARAALAVPVYISAEFTIVSGFDADDIQAAIETAFDDYVNDTLAMGDDVEEFDLDRVVARISGLDNFTITRLTRDPDDTGAADVAISGAEYPTLDVDTDLVIAPA